MVKKISSQPSVSLGCDLGLTCHDSKVSTCCCRPALPSVIELQRWTRKWLMRLNASPLWQIHLLPILGMREWTMEIQMIVILGRSVRWWVTHANETCVFSFFRSWFPVMLQLSNPCGVWPALLWGLQESSLSVHDVMGVMELDLRRPGRGHLISSENRCRNVVFYFCWWV